MNYVGGIWFTGFLARFFMKVIDHVEIFIDLKENFIFEQFKKCVYVCEEGGMFDLRFFFLISL